MYLKGSQGTSLPLNSTRPTEAEEGGSIRTTRTRARALDDIKVGDDLFSLLFPDRLGLNRGGADVIEISDSDGDEDLSRQDGAKGSGSGGPRRRLVVDSDDEQEDEVDEVEDVTADGGLARAIALSRQEAQRAAGTNVGPVAGPSRLG